MAIYTQLTESNLIKITTDFGIPDVLDFNPMQGGNANSSYTVTAKNKKYVLTILEEKNEKQSLDLAGLLQCLQTHEFPTSLIQLTTSGKLLSQHNGKSVLLKQWITGDVIEDLSNNLLKEIGASLAKLHQVPAPDFLSKKHAYGFETFSTVIGKAIDVEYESWLQNQLLKIEKGIPQNLPIGLIHGDLFFDNILFEDGRLKAIIDFEEACHYYLIFDIGMSVTGLCMDDGKVNLAKTKSLIDGYESVRKLETAEKEPLQFFIEYAATATSCWRYWKYNIDSPNEQRKNKHWEMVDIAKQVKSITPQQFLKAILQ